MGKRFNESLTDKESIEDTKKKLLSWLRTVDGSGLPGKNKSMGSYQDLFDCSLYMKLQQLSRSHGKESKWVSEEMARSPTWIGLYSNSIQISLSVSFVVTAAVAQ